MPLRPSLRLVTTTSLTTKAVPKLARMTFLFPTERVNSLSRMMVPDLPAEMAPPLLLSLLSVLLRLVRVVTSLPTERVRSPVRMMAPDLPAERVPPLSLLSSVLRLARVVMTRDPLNLVRMMNRDLPTERAKSLVRVTIKDLPNPVKVMSRDPLVVLLLNSLRTMTMITPSTITLMPTATP